MDLKRFFTQDINNGSAVLTGEEFYHAVKVTRHKIGYNLIVCDGSNFDYYATVKAIKSDSLIAEIYDTAINTSETLANVNLYIGVNKDLDTVVQKAVELGVKSITPFTSQHGNLSEVNYDRLQKIVLTSSKQCGRAALAKANPILTFEQAIKEAAATELLFFYEFAQDARISNTAIDFTKAISIFVGPEGGFSTEEAKQVKDIGGKILGLGKRILRVSTAVCAAVTLILSAAGEM